MPIIPKTSRREHSAETLAIIISMHEKGKSHTQIGGHLKLAKSTMTSIIHRHNRQPEHPLRLTKRASRPLKLDDRARRLFILISKRLAPPQNPAKHFPERPYGRT